MTAQLIAKVHNGLSAGRGTAKAPRDFVLTVSRRTLRERAKPRGDNGTAGRAYFERLVAAGLAQKARRT